MRVDFIIGNILGGGGGGGGELGQFGKTANLQLVHLNQSVLAKCAEKNEEALEDMMSQLESKHGSMYSPEQYHGWAQLIGIKKHKSLDVSPQVPPTHPLRPAPPLRESMLVLNCSIS